MNNPENNHITGILGGLGPDTTAHFYLDLIEQASKKTRPAVCIWSLPLDIQKEAEFIASGKHRDYYLHLLKDGAWRLERAGCTEIVMPCNTVHEFHPTLLEEVSIPFPNLIEIVAGELAERKWTKVLLLATSRTLATNLYQNAVAGSTVDLVLPDPEEQKRLDLLIQGLLGKRTNDGHQAFLAELMKKAGTKKVLLGCTDLQLVIAPSETVVDSMECLVKHTVKKILS